MDIDRYELIIFDCDGVLMDVNMMKVEAFGTAVSEYPAEIVDKFVEYCKNTFGVSRYVKFKDFFDKFANEPFDEDKYQLFLSNYAKECTQIYREASITPGCKELLTNLSKEGKLLYVASGSDEDELRDAFEFRGLSRYFKGIYGSPKTKSESTAEILRQNIARKVLFIGDAVSDMKTAKEHNIDFVYMYNFTVQSAEQDELCKSEALFHIATLENLLDEQKYGTKC